MWLYTHKGFLSIVQNFRDETEVVVRGKYKEDIQAYFPHATIEIDTGIDYKFHACLPKAEVAVRLQRYVMSELNLRGRKKVPKKKVS